MKNFQRDPKDSNEVEELKIEIKKRDKEIELLVNMINKQQT